MAIEQFHEDVEVISKLGDLPNQDDGLTPAQLKAKFDQASIAIKNFINDVLVPVINELEAAKDPEIIYGLDTTLSQAGRAAEAAAVGTALADKFGSEDVIPVANGGTGATTAAAARTNLGAAAASHNHSASQINSGTLPVTRGGTGGATAEAARKSLGAAGNENLLGNWYLSNPVNQRGATSYTAVGFCIDRWSFEQWSAISPTVEIRDGCVAVTCGCTASDTNTTKLRQTIDDPSRLDGKTVTLSAKLKNVSVNGNPRLTIYYNGSKKDMNITSAHANSIISVTATLPTSLSSVYVAIGNDANASGKGGFDIEIEAMKLELGSVSTLANDAPPSYSEQLLECQRYYIRFSANGGGQWLMGGSNGNTAYLPLHLPVPMRGTAQPTLSWSGSPNAFENLNLYNYVSGGSAEITSLSIPKDSDGNSANVNRQSFVLYAAHASNAIGSKSIANLRIYTGGWISLSCEI